jgi:pimeloyl-ACP methyl ester carboxylesterase
MRFVPGPRPVRPSETHHPAGKRYNAATQQEGLSVPIDILHRAANPPRSPHPVLFVPGAFTGGWMWAETFLPHFAERGFDSYAMSFRAHGSQGWPLHSLGLKDFVSDLAHVVDHLPAPPVIVGHSLGGLVAYEFARQRAVPGIVMFSPVPPDGTLRSFVSLAMVDPVSASKMAAMSLVPPVRLLGEPPLGVYSRHVPRDIARAFTRRLRAESWRVLMEAFVRRRSEVRPLGLPTYVVGATGDHLIPASEVRRTGRMLDAPCRIFEGFSHTPFVEPGWEAIADDLAEWIDDLRHGARATTTREARA